MYLFKRTEFDKKKIEEEGDRFNHVSWLSTEGGFTPSANYE